MAATFNRELRERLVKEADPLVHEELAGVIEAVQARVQPRRARPEAPPAQEDHSPPPAPPEQLATLRPAATTTRAEVNDNPQEYLQRLAGPDRTVRTSTFDERGEPERMPARPAAAVAPTTMTIQLPFTSAQSVVTVGTNHVPALLAIDARWTIADMHLQARGLATAVNIDRVVDVVTAFGQPHDPGRDGWLGGQDDGRLFAAVHRRQMSGSEVDWFEISDELGDHDATACEARWMVIGWGLTTEVPAVGERAVEPLTQGRGQEEPPAWTSEDDAWLRQAIDDQIDWTAIAALLPTPSADDCQRRWTRLSP
jgi:hypothetical protein